MSSENNGGADARRGEGAPGADLAMQREFWSEWNATHRELRRSKISGRQREIVLAWLTRLQRTDLNLIEAGCGAGWFIPDLLRFGRVTATDLAAEVVARAQERNPDAKVVAGDYMTLDFGRDQFDVAVSLEVLSHVADQRAFLSRIADQLAPDGLLMLATQNRPVLERHNKVAPPAPGQLRKWFDKEELRTLLSERFDVIELFSVTPIANRGVMRLVNAKLLNAPIRWLVGERLEHFKERQGLGWTLMALARRR